MTEFRRASKQWSYRRKTVSGLLVTASFFAVTELVLLLFGIAPVSSERDPFVGFESSIPLYVQRNRGGEPWLETANSKLRFFNHQSFPRRKPDNTYRIFCVGGSTTFGRPYDDRTSFPAWLRELLPVADPDRQWEVINAGGVSYASYRVAALIDELVKYSPDLVVIYSGHNEFLEDRTYRQTRTLPAASRRMAALFAHTRTFALVDRLAFGSKSSGSEKAILPAEVDTMLDHSVGPEVYHREPGHKQDIVEHFRFNLTRMVDTARSAGARVLLVTPASNLKDFSPFKSEHREGLTKFDREHWSKLVLEADRLADQGQLESALQRYREAERIDDQRADLHYRIGTILHQMDEHEEAHASYLSAIEHDVCPLRILPEMQLLVEQVAVSKRVPLVDFRSIVSNDCEMRYGHSSPGREYFVDHVHPTIQSHRLLALSLVNALAQTGTVLPKSTWCDEAIAEVSTRIESRVDEEVKARALTNLAQVLSWAGKQEEAAPLAMTAVELRAQSSLASDAEAMFYAAVGHAMEGRDREAIELFRRVVRLQPANAQAHWRLGALLYDDLQFEQAELHFREAIRLDPRDAYSRRMLAAVLTRFEQREQALELLLQAATLDPQDETIRIDIERVRAQMQRG